MTGDDVHPADDDATWAPATRWHAFQDWKATGGESDTTREARARATANLDLAGGAVGEALNDASRAAAPLLELRYWANQGGDPMRTGGVVDKAERSVEAIRVAVEHLARATEIAEAAMQLYREAWNEAHGGH